MLGCLNLPIGDGYRSTRGVLGIVNGQGVDLRVGKEVHDRLEYLAANAVEIEINVIVRGGRGADLDLICGKLTEGLDTILKDRINRGGVA